MPWVAVVETRPVVLLEIVLEIVECQYTKAENNRHRNVTGAYLPRPFQWCHIQFLFTALSLVHQMKKF